MSHYLRGQTTSIVILSFEGIEWLWEQTRLNAAYWHLFNKEKDTDDLMKLQPVIITRLEKNDLSREFANTKVRIVSLNAIKALWQHVFERNRYYGYKDRDPDYIATSVVQETYMDNYMRLKS